MQLSRVNKNAVNPEKTGTKAAAHYILDIKEVNRQS